MCIKIRQPEPPQPLAPPPAITPRVEKDTSVKPQKQELVDPADQKGVEFGSSKKKGSGITTRAKGTEALRIPLNTGGTGAAGSGTGVNA